MTSDTETLAVQADAHFAVIPEWVVFSDISDKALRLYCVLRRVADNRTGASYHSRRSLAKLINAKDPKVVDRAVAELEHIGALTVTRDRYSDAGDRTSNLYVIRSTPAQEVVALEPPPSGSQTTTVVAQEGEELRATRTEKEQTPLIPPQAGGQTPNSNDPPRRCTRHRRPRRNCDDCHQPPDPPPPPWCGQCDPQGQYSLGARMIPTPDGNGVTRCPRCHPAATRQARQP